MKLLCILVASALLATSASAATLRIDTDSAFYSSGDTITITMRLTTDGSEMPATGVFAEVRWNGDATLPPSASSQGPDLLTTFSGALVWIPGSGACISASRCVMLNQSLITTPLPVDAGSYTATLLLKVGAAIPFPQSGGFGTNSASSSAPLNLRIVADTFDAFDLRPQDVSFGQNAQNVYMFGVPEPGTGAMFGLGLLGLGFRSRREARP